MSVESRDAISSGTNVMTRALIFTIGNQCVQHKKQLITVIGLWPSSKNMSSVLMDTIVLRAELNQMKSRRPGA